MFTHSLTEGMHGNLFREMACSVVEAGLAGNVLGLLSHCPGYPRSGLELTTAWHVPVLKFEFKI
jgi:hypothetical protein